MPHNDTPRRPASYADHTRHLLDMIDEYRAPLSPEEDAAVLEALIGMLHVMRQRVVRKSRHAQRSARRRPTPADHLNNA